MLRRYATGSREGSGGVGKVTSGMDGEVNDAPLETFADAGDLDVELLLFVEVAPTRSPLVLIFVLFRLNRPIVAVCSRSRPMVLRGQHVAGRVQRMGVVRACSWPS